MYFLKPQEAFRELNECVPHINCGGCGIFAEHLYTALVALGKKPSLVIITDNSYYMRKRIESGKKNSNSTLYHIVVKLGKYYYDNNGVYDEYHIKNMYWGANELCEIEIDRLKELNENPRGWNSLFDREFIPHIKTRLEKLVIELNTKNKFGRLK